MNISALLLKKLGYEKETALKKALDDLAQAKKNEETNTTFSLLARSIISQIEYGIILIDNHRIMQLINPFAEKFLDCAGCVGTSYQETLHCDFSPFESALTGSVQKLPGNFEIKTAKGSAYISGTITPIIVNYTPMIACIFADNSADSARVAENNAFFSAASHELRTPLTVIRFAASILLEKIDTLSREKIIEYLSKIDKTSEHLVHIVNDFLNISRIEQGRILVEKKSFDISALTDEVIKELTDLAHAKKLYIQHDPNITHRIVLGDKTKAKEILTNLISNAMKYTIQGGITITHMLNKTMIETKIIDTGAGIPTDYQRLLFRKFSQIGNARTQTTAKSTGLGLYISKKFALLMDGDVVLEKSEPGNGSTFTLKLPIG